MPPPLGWAAAPRGLVIAVPEGGAGGRGRPRAVSLIGASEAIPGLPRALVGTVAICRRGEAGRGSGGGDAGRRVVSGGRIRRIPGVWRGAPADPQLCRGGGRGGRRPSLSEPDLGGAPQGPRAPDGAGGREGVFGSPAVPREGGERPLLTT